MSPFFYPECISTGRYNTRLAKALVEAGCRVDVITSHPLYPSWRPQRSDATLAGMSIARGGAYLRFPRSPVLRRAVLELWFSVFVVFHGLRRASTYEVVVPVFPPSLFFFCLHFALRPRQRVVCIVHDLQAVHTASAGTGLFRRALDALIVAVEGRALRACSRVIFLSAEMAQLARTVFGLQADRLQVVYPFVTIGEPTQLDARGLEALERIFVGGAAARHLVYCGALGEKQNPEGLADLVAFTVAAYPQIHFHIYSEGRKFDQLRADPRLASAARVHCGSLLPESLLAHVYRRADLNVVPQATGTSKGSMPSKVPNILACRGRVFAICDAGSELGTLVREFGAGLVVNTWDPELMLATLDRHLHEPRATDRYDDTFGLDHRVIARFGVASVVAAIME